MFWYVIISLLLTLVFHPNGVGFGTPSQLKYLTATLVSWIVLVQPDAVTMVKTLACLLLVSINIMVNALLQ